MTNYRNSLLDPHHDDSTDDEDGENTTLLGGNRPTNNETSGWDVFRDPPPRMDSGSMANQTLVNVSMKILKLVCYALTFVVVLGCSVIAKGTLLFMTSQLPKGKATLYCNKELGNERQFIAVLPEEERVLWRWCLLLAFAIPEVQTLFRSVRMVVFKSSGRPTALQFFLLFTMETFHTIGMALLIFVILPNLDVVKGAMLTNCVCFVPGLLGILSRDRSEENHFLKVLVDVAAVAAQATGFVVWPLLHWSSKPELWLIPVTVFLVSCGWWENYTKATKDTSLSFAKHLGRSIEKLKEARYFCYIFISVWKILCFFCTMLLILLLQKENVGDTFTLLPKAFGPHVIQVREVKPVYMSTSAPNLNELMETGEVEDVAAWANAGVYVLLVHIFAGYFCYVFGKFSCKIMIQMFSYAFPVNLATPVVISLLISACGVYIRDPCTFHDFLPDYLFFIPPTFYSVSSFIFQQHAWAWLLWLLSQTWITLHIWTPKAERLATTEKLFVCPMYNGLLIDQSLALNRRRDLKTDIKNSDLNEVTNEDHYETISNYSASSNPESCVKSSDHITRVYACATMWHETKEEMMEMLKSIFRMDADHSARSLAQKYLAIVDPDYYEFETHIFFDDAFMPSKDNKDESVVNAYVRLLVSVIDEAATLVHETRMRIRPPKKLPTPYGGRLVWTLPGKTKLVAHLKDKNKIRHRKRWSQVMYMYYLLGHRLMDQPIHVDRKAVIAQNTYLLTLDGDIDFQPNAVHLLIDLMKKNQNLGAACGRIHPVGSGPMVWYQMFEYAIGHWLQKSTEHMIGCVLCSPGCFSLFRGKALMDDNVMAKYTTKSDQARHYVQYDQGEDRWLCTLLLQRGYRVEYSAASDAYTHCPEGFNEFYNQRRRWVPSTMANILDLLGDYKRTVKINDNISMPYIVYQLILMGSTILGPGTIFLMLVGAFVAAFHIDNWTSFIYNILPILAYMLICFTCKSKFQLFAAMVISAIYGLVMMAVLVGILLQIELDGPLAPSSLFLFIVAGEMVVTAMFHPQELYCLPAGIIYYVTVPSMYLLLIIYSIFNLNDVTWGTRENKAAKSEEELEEERKEAEEAKKKSFLGFFQSTADKLKNKEEGSFELSFAGLFKIMCCTQSKGVSEQQQQLLQIAASLESLNKRLDNIERSLEPSFPTSRRRTLTSVGREHTLESLAEEPSEPPVPGVRDDDTDTITSETKQERDDNVNPYWIEDKDLKKGYVDYIPSYERQFWEGLITKYLSPIDDNKDERKRIAKDLKDLRDTSVFAFFMLNALFVLTVFLLQLSKDEIHVDWPLDVKTNITFNDEDDEVVVTKSYLQLEPIGFIFLLFFAVILFIQFTAMLFHRVGTLSHILASTEIIEKGSKDGITHKNFLDIAQTIQNLADFEEGTIDPKQDKVGRRTTIHALVEQQTRRPTKHMYLEEVAKHNMGLTEGATGLQRLSGKIKRKKTILELQRRRSSILMERRRSQLTPDDTVRSSVLSAGSSAGRSSGILNRHSTMSGGHVNQAFDSSGEDGVSLRHAPRRMRSSVSMS